MDYREIDSRLSTIGKMLEEDINNWEAWAAKADLLYELGMYEAAIKCCDKSLSHNPDNVLTLNTKVKALYDLGRHKEAMDCLEYIERITKS